MNLHKHACLSSRCRAVLANRILIHGLGRGGACGGSQRPDHAQMAAALPGGRPRRALLDRSSLLTHCPHATPPAVVAQLIERH